MNARTTQPAAVTPTSGDWLVTLALYRAALNAGFTVSPIKELKARDGVAWTVTLSLHGKKVIEASNEGNGGANWIEPVYGKPGASADPARVAADRAKAQLMALPEVTTFLAAFQLQVLSLAGEAAEQALSDPSSLLPDTFATNDDYVGQVIEALGDVRKLLPKLKKLTSSGLHWVQAKHGFGSYSSLRLLSDTPNNRKMAQSKFSKQFENFQGFLPDLIAGL